MFPRASTAAPREPGPSAAQQCATVEALLATVRRADSGAWAHPALCCRTGVLGRGLFVDRDVPAGSTLAVIPRSMCVHTSVARISGSDGVAEGVAAHQALASLLLSVQPPPATDDADARVRAAYMAALPTRDEARAFPLCWPEAALQLLHNLGDPGSAANVRSARAAARIAHAAAAPHASYDDWLWAQAMAQSRMYPGWPTPEEQRADLAPWWLIPVIDIANHAPFVGCGAPQERNALYQCFTLPDLFRLLGGKYERESLAGAVRAVVAAARRQEPAATLVSIRRLAAGDEVLVSYCEGDEKPGGGFMAASDELLLYGISDERAPRSTAFMGAISAGAVQAVVDNLMAAIEEAAHRASSGAIPIPAATSMDQALAHVLPLAVEPWSRDVAASVARIERSLASASAREQAAERAAALHARRRVLAGGSAALSMIRDKMGAQGLARLRTGVRAGVAAGLAPITDADGAARAAALVQLIEDALLAQAPTKLPLPRDDPFFRNSIAP